MPTTTDYLNELITQKTALANNLVSKGVQASENETFNTLVPKVLDISSGVGQDTSYRFPLITTGTVNANTIWTYSMVEDDYYIQLIDDTHAYKVTYSYSSSTHLYTVNFYLCNYDKATDTLSGDALITQATFNTMLGLPYSRECYKGSKKLVFYGWSGGYSTYYGQYEKQKIKYIVITLDDSYHATYFTNEINNLDYYQVNSNQSSNVSYNINVYRDINYIYIVSYGHYNVTDSYNYQKPRFHIYILNYNGTIIKTISHIFNTNNKGYQICICLFPTENYLFVLATEGINTDNIQTNGEKIYYMYNYSNNTLTDKTVTNVSLDSKSLLTSRNRYINFDNGDYYTITWTGNAYHFTYKTDATSIDDFINNFSFVGLTSDPYLGKYYWTKTMANRDIGFGFVDEKNTWHLTTYYDSYTSNIYKQSFNCNDCLISIEHKHSHLALRNPGTYTIYIDRALAANTKVFLNDQGVII